MSITSKRFWKKRVWLNPAKSYDDGYMITSRDRDGEFHFKLADCGRILDLNLYWENKRGKKLRMNKINKIIYELTYLRDKMEEADDE